MRDEHIGRLHLGSHKIVDHGPNSQRFNVVILGDGYRSSELTQFATNTDNFLDLLKATDPYPDLWCSFLQCLRIDVASTDSGADDPGTCGDGSTDRRRPKTYFDSTFAAMETSSTA